MIQLPENSLDMQIMNSIHHALEVRIEKIRADIIKKAQEGFEAEVRAVVGTVAINLLSHYSLERVNGGTDLRITVKVSQP